MIAQNARIGENVNISFVQKYRTGILSQFWRLKMEMENLVNSNILFCETLDKSTVKEIQKFGIL